MTSSGAVGLLIGLPLALGFTMGIAFAQEGSTVVPKTPIGTPVTTGSVGSGAAPQLRPSLGDNATPAGTTAPAGELTPPTLDEGASWQAAVEAAKAPTPLIGAEQDAAVKRINAYFNGITNLQGSFEQTDPDNKHSTGRFYVQRPGKIRFDYAPPSALRIVADGHSLAIEDSDLKTIEKYPIDSTPFRLLLAKSVDLARDARIIGVESQEGSLDISLEDKTGNSAGQIKLFFDTDPELALREWLITDAQGLTTKVTVSNIVSGRQVAADFFQAQDTFQPFR
jgi:outer membrane lipoprotein-sorting protein